MKSYKKLLPILAGSSLLATLPVALSSCSIAALTTVVPSHDMIGREYINHVLPKNKCTIEKDVLLSVYWQDIQNYSNILKDDMMYTLSHIFHNQQAKGNVETSVAKFTSYYFWIYDIEFDTYKVEQDSKVIDMPKVSFTVGANLKGECTQDDSALLKDITKFDLDFNTRLSCGYTLDSKFDVEIGEKNVTPKFNLIPARSEFDSLQPTYHIFTEGTYSHKLDDGSVKDENLSSEKYISIDSKVEDAIELRLFHFLWEELFSIGLNNDRESVSSIPFISSYLRNIDPEPFK